MTTLVPQLLQQLHDRILSWPRFWKRGAVVVADLILLPLAFWSAEVLRFDSFHADVAGYGMLTLAAPLFAVPVFVVLGLYHAVVRFMGDKALLTVVSGVTASVLMLMSLAALTHTQGLSRGVFGIYWCLAILYVGASRFLARSYLLRLDRHRRDRRKVAIYGAGNAGAQLALAFASGNEYQVIAFFDDKKDIQGARIAGAKVYSPEDIAKVVADKDIGQILLAMPSAPRATISTILQRLEPLGITLKTMPSLAELASGKVDVSMLREVDIEDLLGREPIVPDQGLLTRRVTGKSVLVTGAGGSIGSELCRQIAALAPRRLVLLELSEYALYAIDQELQAWRAKTGNSALELVPVLGSALDQERMTDLLRQYEVATVYHAAAYKHVPIVEHNPAAGVRNNVQGTLRMARAAQSARVETFVLISTDKAVRPTNVMGASKRLAELVLQALAAEGGQTCFTMVRFGNVLGSSGSVVPLFRRQIKAGGPITLTHPDITRFFMTIPEAAQLVIQASALAAGGEVFVLDMGDPVRILDLARRMVHLSGLAVRDAQCPDGDIEIRITGLRPGEKLYEELLIGGDVQPTRHPRILRLQEHMLSWQQLVPLLERVDGACNGHTPAPLKAALKAAVEEYSPRDE
ncbi:polysaccharide biosynthesis protein [Azospira inquinata]|uniref:polysaccharide biosynthesis protein n=1 Tax=Azospira inquinata TaxID=2785627 RepID=UPI001C0AA41C|nr:nucleoside-diphosphate sugar epimerase/dehydratase [Azospira inquinata]QWT46753.1 polysaccharide biosynthesis protein [Azospira inquinata]